MTTHRNTHSPSRPRPYTGPAPMSAAATAGLRRRLALRAASAIEVARASGDWEEAERLTAAELDRRDLERTRDGAAALARLPLGERIGS